MRHLQGPAQASRIPYSGRAQEVPERRYHRGMRALIGKRLLDQDVG